jgi:hypothetical protein
VVMHAARSWAATASREEMEGLKIGEISIMGISLDSLSTTSSEWIVVVPNEPEDLLDVPQEGVTGAGEIEVIVN